MKRISVILSAVFLVFLMCGCGNVSSAETKDVSSEIYTQEDISEGIKIVKRDFRKDFNGCTLTEIYYAGDEISEDYSYDDADQVMVLKSSFETDSKGGDGSLNPDSTYDDWMWILVRNDGGKWQHIDHGY